MKENKLGARAEHTCETWIVWILSCIHQYVWKHIPTRLMSDGLKQVFIDEIFCNRGHVTKSIAFQAAQRVDLDFWAAVEVLLDGRNGKCIFRFIRKRSEAIEEKHRGNEKIIKFVLDHISAHNIGVSDGWAATLSAQAA